MSITFSPFKTIKKGEIQPIELLLLFKALWLLKTWWWAGLWNQRDLEAKADRFALNSTGTSIISLIIPNTIPPSLSNYT